MDGFFINGTVAKKVYSYFSLTLFLTRIELFLVSTCSSWFVLEVGIEACFLDGIIST